MLPLPPPDFVDALRQHEPQLRRLCRLYCPPHDPDEQHDLYQEIVAQLWQAWPSYAGRAKLSTWLYRVALNVAISSLRQRTRRPVARLDETAARYVPEPPAAGPDPDDLAELYRAIGQLSPVDKALVLLRLEERPDQEVADILGLTPNHVRVKMHRALTTLRHLLTTLQP